MTRAVGWLLSHRSRARWKGYPEMTSSATSESISGLAIHALHLAAPDRAVSLDNDWLSSLPDRVIAASDGENTYVELEEHSSFDSIAPGATYTQTVTWYLRRLPMGTDRSVGSAALIAAALSTLGRN